MIEVSFACNDSRGHFAGHVLMLDFTADDPFETELRAYHEDIGSLGNGLAMARTDELVQLKTADVTCVVAICRGWSHWAGNMFWESCAMAEPDARVLARFALAHGFHAEEWNSEGIFADIVKAAKPR